MLTVEQLQDRLSDCLHRLENGPTWKDKTFEQIYIEGVCRVADQLDRATWKAVEIKQWRGRLEKMIAMLKAQIEGVEIWAE